MPKPKRSSASGKKKTNAAAAKRPRNRPRTPVPLKTPFVSLLTNKDYLYDAKEEEPHTVVILTPTSSTAAPPANTGPFLKQAAMSFAKEVHDILLGPEYLVLIFTIDENKVSTYYNFVKQAKFKLPNSDIAVCAKAACLDELLEAYVDKAVLQPYLIATGLRSADGMDTESSGFSTDTDTSEEELLPAGPKNSPRKPLLAIRQLPPTTSTTSAPGSANASAANQLPEMIPETTEPIPAPVQEAPTTMDVEPTSHEVNIPAVQDKDTERPAPAAVTRGRPRTRYTPIDFSILKVEVPPPPQVLTILIRPAEQGTSLKDCHPAKLARELTKYGKWTAQRHIRDGGLAIDYESATPVEPLLAISTLLDLPVKISLPATASTSAGVITGVHWELTEDEIMENMCTQPDTKILLVKRLAKEGQRSWTVKLVFDGATRPTHVTLYNRRYPVKHYNTTPLICYNCARYGHAAKVCRSTRRCLNCSQDHNSRDCPNLASPLCSSCKGSHPANSRACPTWGFQMKVSEVKTTNQVTFKTARQAVAKAAQSYAAAVKTPAANPQPPKQATQPPKQATQQSRNFATNTVNPQPLPAPADAATLAKLFTDLIRILTTAATTSNFAGAIQEVTSLFSAHIPDLPVSTA